MKKYSFIMMLMMLTISVMAQEEEMKQKFILETKVEAPVFVNDEGIKDSNNKLFNQYLVNELSYLSEIQGIDDEGVVSVNFMVEPDGSVSKVHVANSVSRELDNAVIKAITKSDHKWLAGKINGMTTAMNKTVFVKFDAAGNASHNEFARDYLMKAVEQIYLVNGIRNDPGIASGKKEAKVSRKANLADMYLSKAEQFKPDDLSILYWQARVCELKGNDELKTKLLDRYVELAENKGYENTLISTGELAVITLK